MSVAQNQSQIFLQLLTALRPYWHTDRSLPERLTRLLSKDRRFGSRDRRLYRELIHTALRFWPWIEPTLKADPQHAVQMIAWLAADTRDTRDFRHALLTAWPACPTSLLEKSRVLNLVVTALLPPWLETECPEAFAPKEIEAILRRAPLWIRLQADSREAVLEDFSSRAWPYEPSSLLPEAIKLPIDASVDACATYHRGQFEVQDLGSQMVLAAHAIQRHEHWLDACAGAGGKTLQLARLVGPDGHVWAADIRQAALHELQSRAKRAQIPNISIATQSDQQSFDGVLIDAPCSGSGTWRRSPHLKWSTSPDTVHAYAQLQRQILKAHAHQVRPGGKLIYATCSLARSENESIIADFLRENSDFEVTPAANTFGYKHSALGLTILPARHDTDAFFTCCLRRV